VTYIRNSIDVIYHESFSNNNVQIAATLLPKSGLAIINFYRPPNTTLPAFSEAMLWVNQWLNTVEVKAKKVPSIIFCGDLNMGFLESWDPEDIAVLHQQVMGQEARGLQVAQDKRQASLLLSFIEDRILTQQFKHGTRNHRILDLLFTSDPYFANNVEYIENHKISDHKTMVVRSNLILNQSNKVLPRPSFTTSTLPDFNLDLILPETWALIRSELPKLSWEAFSGPNPVVEDMAKSLFTNLEIAISTHVVRNTRDKPSTRADGTKYKSKNIIPSEIRLLLRRRSQASSRLQKCKSV
jgi:hypothetical protein